jgi:PilX N-terminal
MRPPGCEHGAALLVVLLLTSLVAAIAASLIVHSTADVTLSASYRTGLEVLYAADAGLERAIADLAPLPDWSPLLAAPPANLTAPYSGTGLLFQAPDRRLWPIATLLADRQAAAPAGLGADTPVWRLYAQMPLAALWPAPAAVPPVGLLVFVADDGADGDGDATVDANGRLLVHVDAYGVLGARRSVEALIERVEPGAVRLAIWKEAR